MQKPFFTTQFKKDYKKIIKIFNNPNEVDSILWSLIKWDTLKSKFNDHPLKWNWLWWRDCHIRWDLVLIYKIKWKEIIFWRIWSHSELFK